MEVIPILKVREMLIVSDGWGRKCPYPMTPTRIVVHNTANDASAENEIRYMQSNGAETSFHYAVDDKEAVLGIPLTRNTWNAGDGGNGKGNREGISIEICYSKSGGARFISAEKNAAELIASLLKKYGWGIDRVTKHQDYSGKYCPHRTLDMGWDRFLNLVKQNMSDKAEKKSYADKYEHDGLTFVRCKSFKIQYHDKSKRSGNYANYFNGGFFGYFKSSKGEDFTLPVGNLVCDCSVNAIPSPAHKYLDSFVSGGKLRYGCNNNQSTQYKGKKVSTLVVPASGKPYIDDVNAPPAGCKYAISGVPTVRHGDDVDYYNYVKPMGFDESCMYATYRSWIGVRDGEIWVITGKTKDKNYIYGMEFWKKVKNEGFDDIIALDGGGSYYFKNNGKVTTTAGTRYVNNLVIFTS